MLVYVLFVVIYGSNKMTSFQYEFKSRIQCENAGKNFEKRFYRANSFCQEVRK